FVWEVPSDGPSKGVLEPGDVITKLNGNAVTDVQALRNEIASMAPGTEAKLEIVRDGKTKDVSVKVGEQPEELASTGAGRRGTPQRGERPEAGGPTGARPRAPRRRGERGADPPPAETLGLRLSDVSDQLAEKYGLAD